MSNRFGAVQAMGPRLFGPAQWKEIRMLSPMWWTGLVAGCLVPWLSWHSGRGMPHEGLWAVSSWLAWFAFLGSILVMATVLFGGEFHHRTLALLLTQPRERSRVWRDKLVTISAIVFGIVLVAGAVRLWAGPSVGAGGVFGSAGETALFGENCFVPGLLFAVTTVGAAPFWTLITGTTIGGVAFSVSGQFSAALLVNSVCERAHVNQGLGLGVGAIAYSLVFLWLGWRQFSRLEVRDGRAEGGEPLLAGPSDSGTSKLGSRGSLLRRLTSPWVATATEAIWLDRALRCRKRGSLGNLFRKELRLQKPVYLLGVLFIICWLIALGYNLIHPTKGYENLFTAIAAWYVPLVLLLAGSISVSEENALGLAGWQLTLPAPSRRQWWIKLAASLAAGAAAGWLVPLGLAFGTGLVIPKAASSPHCLIGEAGLTIWCISGLLFVLSFWAVGLVGNTVRAVLASLSGLVALTACLAAGTWAAESLSGLPAGLGTRMAEAWLSPSDTLYPYLTKAAQYGIPASVLVLILIALAQSLWLFRRVGVPGSKRISYPIMLVIAALVLGFFRKCL